MRALHDPTLRRGDVRHRGACYRVPTMVGTPFDELVHRVNNLLGTIEVQVEVAALEGSLAAHQEALRHIVDSARRTRDEIRRLRQAPGGANTGSV